MGTRTYATLFALIEAKCGVQFTSIEQPRVKAWVNDRAQSAYDACDYWPRWIKIAEERTVENGNLVPFTQLVGEPIGEFIRIFMAYPYAVASPPEYDFAVTTDGALLISGDQEPTSAWVNYRIDFTPNYGDGNGGETTDIPKEWFQYLAHGAYSDFLRSEGQQEKAVIADQEAQRFLDDEMCKPEVVRTAQLLGNKISTNLNMQTRYTGASYPV